MMMLLQLRKRLLKSSKTICKHLRVFFLGTKVMRWKMSYLWIDIWLIFLIVGMQTSWFDALSNKGFQIIHHEYYRLITANFIHFGLMHIFCNCYSLVNLGSVMEYLLGQKRYGIVLGVSALSTTLLPCLYFIATGNGANSVMGGISGAIFGLMGALLALAIKFKNIYAYLFKQISSSVLLMLLISFLIPSISLAGHISGMIGGFIVMLLIIRFMPLNIWKKQTTTYNNIVN